MEDNKVKSNVEFEKIPITVTSSGQEVDITHITDIDHTCIIGIAQVFSNKDALPNCEIQLDVDGQEVFPKGFESKLIYAGEDVPPDDKYFRYINRDVKQVKITGKFKDGDSLSSFSQYTANIYLMVLTDREY